MHSIIGHLASAELEPFLQAVRRLESGQEPELAPAGDSLLEQLMLYAMLEPEEEESGEAQDG